MTYLEQAKEKYPELFEKQFCRICGKEFYYNKRQIVKKFHNLNKNKKICIGCCKQHNTKIQLLNDGNPFANKNIQKKIEEIKENKYGHKNYSNWKQTEQTNLKRYGCKCVFGNKEIRKHARNTCKSRYGVEYYSQTDEWNIKFKKTKKERYGDENYVNIEQAKSTCRKHHGVDFYVQSQEFKDLYRNKECIDKIEQKKYETRKRNKTFNNRSKSEIRCYELLKTKFKDAEHSYRDDNRYPFNCDMYIPSKDLFIECHFGWAHGGAPFDKNNKEHLKELEKCIIKKDELNWQGKKKDGYKEKIKVWTISDPLKLKTFIDNKLNYKIFYKEEEFIEWFKGL